jgi:hypothetical protein
MPLSFFCATKLLNNTFKFTTFDKENYALHGAISLF